MKKKTEYEEAKIEILLFESKDIVTASQGGDPLGGSSGPSGGGWTAPQDW